MEKQKPLNREENTIFDQPEDVKKPEEEELQKKVKKEDLVSNFRIKFKKNRKSSNTETLNLNKNDFDALNW